MVRQFYNPYGYGYGGVGYTSPVIYPEAGQGQGPTSAPRQSDDRSPRTRQAAQGGASIGGQISPEAAQNVATGMSGLGMLGTMLGRSNPVLSALSFGAGQYARMLANDKARQYNIPETGFFSQANLNPFASSAISNVNATISRGIQGPFGSMPLTPVSGPGSYQGVFDPVSKYGPGAFDDVSVSVRPTNDPNRGGRTYSGSAARAAARSIDRSSPGGRGASAGMSA